MTTPDSITVRPVAAADRAGWDALWAGYQQHFKGSVPPQVSERTFASFLDPGSALHCLVAERGPALIGFAHVSDAPFAWTGSPVAFLQDLFVAQAARGSGAGRALLAGVYAAAEARGCANLFWLSDVEDERLNRFYRALAHQTPFVHFMQKPWDW